MGLVSQKGFYALGYSGCTAGNAQETDGRGITGSVLSQDRDH